MAFIDQGEFEAMKTLSVRRTPHCDKDQFHAKMTVSTSTVSEVSLFKLGALTRKINKNGTFATAYFCV